MCSWQAVPGWVIHRNPDNRTGTVSGDTVPEGTEDPTGESRTPAVGETSADTQTETMTTEEPQPTEPSEELPKEVVYHTVDDSYFDDAVFIGDSRTVGMYEYGGLEETSTFYASTGLTIYKMFDSKIVAVPGQKKKITVEEALSEKQFAKIYLMIGINEMGTGTVESFMKAYGEAVQHLQQLQPDAGDLPAGDHEGDHGALRAGRLYYQRGHRSQE